MFTPTILRIDSVDSTNLEAARQAKAGAAEGLCIVAREQTAGRGRLDRRWLSPKDAGLYLSIVLRPQLELSDWPLISLVAALAVSDALLQTCDLKVDIKWPNDIYVSERKLAGILVETVETGNGPAAIVGIGINLTNQDFPLEMSVSATSVEAATGSVPDANLLLQALVKAMQERYESLQAEGGIEHATREWCANSTYAYDRRVRVSSNNETFEGMTRGLANDGALRVETHDGRIRVVRAADITALRATR